MVANMKMLVKDTQANSMFSEALKGGNLASGEASSARCGPQIVPGALQNLTIDNTTLGNTIDHSTLPPGQPLPKAKEVWRWVKSLLQNYIVLLN